VNNLGNHSGKGNDGSGYHLSIPVYTDEQLASFSIATLQHLKASHEGAGLIDTALRCLEFIEQKQLREPVVKRQRKKTASEGTEVTPKTKRPRVRPKNSKAISWHFEDLGAPLHNIVWSWGALSREKRDIFLRVWEDEIERIDGEIIVQLTLHSKFIGGKNCGYRERIKHIEYIKNNYKGFVVVCVAKDTKKSPRKIRSYDKEKIYPILRIMDIAGDQWAVLGTGIKISDH
jgi:hypothetical protein